MQTLSNPQTILQETGERADAVFHARIESHVAPQDRFKFLVLDVDTGDYEIDDDEEVASERMEARRPDGRLYLMRADGGPAYYMGTWAGVGK